MRLLSILAVLILGLWFDVAAEGSVTAAQLLGILNKGTSLTGSIFDSDKGYLVSLKKLGNNAIFYQADMDIDCDGTSDNLCNTSTDPAFQPQISAGGNVHASVTPFFVFPEPHTAFDYSKNGFGIGSVAAIIYNNQVIYTPFLDECGVGNDNGQYLIGEASYAAAKLLGINSNPSNGGVDNGVTYIIFTGPSGEVSSYTDHNEAVSVGTARATELVKAYAGVINGNAAGKSYHREFQIDAPFVSVKASGAHSMEIFNFLGRAVMAKSGVGAAKYNLSQLKPGYYVVKVATEKTSCSERMILY
jgi:hypothetical protein